MPGPFPNLPPDRRGTVHRLHVDCPHLAMNPWGDPSARDVWVYEPVDAAARGPLPAILILPGFAGTGDGPLVGGLGEPSLPARLDRLIDAGCPPVRAVFPDAMTTLGGSQFLDSPAVGPYQTWLLDTIVPRVEAIFPSTGRWAVAGRSSGGFGAFHLAARAPDRFVAAALHAADAGFDLAYLGDIPAALRGIQRAGGLDRLVAHFWATSRPDADLFAAMNLACMACVYAPEPGRRPLPGRLPFDPDTGTLHLDVLDAWAAHDPVRCATLPAVQAALSRLDLLFVDVGTRDEYGLHFGAARLVRALREGGVPVEYETFDGGHRGTAFRWDRSLPRLAHALHGLPMPDARPITAPDGPR